ncbi:DNA (cytosine-5)-methyltransferase DRM2 [Sorghum bicolor]|uniref:DNA (cytosine-5-)-methyltransferase n=1 Tax=Sorghum bicolor TaxID=4558 RepID=C5WSU3_SORBI|nr:DNA (cytosine-5)-methyltransferase DRM2 [Sorghum bicolor]EER95283.1 hypothetical protein SORBI_3001G458100 [Sorghum bicolor]|eukprot:XP_002468285.1 DNA (cytosine-5)-methyltransferase DRM2 [Sorghum bicolor]
MADRVGGSDDGDKSEWNSDGEVARSLDGAGSPIAPSRNKLKDAPGPSLLVNGAGPSASLVEDFVGMGLIKGNGDGGAESLLELLLAYKAIGNDPSLDKSSASVCGPRTICDDKDILANWDAHDASTSSDRDHASDDSGDEDFLQGLSQKDEKIESLVRMGFPKDEAEMAIVRCGQDAPMSVLIDLIYSSEASEDGYYGNFSGHEDDSFGGRKEKRKRSEDAEQGSSHDEPMPLPNPMVGFNLPNVSLRSVDRSLPSKAIGPPFFYYENVAIAPKGVWTTISQFLYDIQPEFVDSRFLCAAARKRGYVHNLPIENRSPLLPLPPKTIFEAFPHTKKWWPSWDPRKQFNCLLTSMAKPKLTEQIHHALAKCKDPPPRRVQKYVLETCRTANLVWVGLNKVAHLEPDEMEFLLGFPKDHTRGIGRPERFKSLGNSFHVDTVAYHLSALRDMFPHGMNVLSLFSGIGGAEVALHRLDIRMKTVVSVEISETNRFVLRTWWNQTQTGTLIEITDVQSLTTERLESCIRRIGGFDLVIGGSPCNNLAGRNRFHRDGLEGEQSSLFYHYYRILDTVKSIMGRM